MSRRFTRLFLLSAVLFTGNVLAIGLGDIKLESALNEPLRAQIVLLSANSEELADLTVALASSETFERYGIDRPFYLQGVEFNVVNGGVDGSIIEIRSRAPITEPFLTFLVEATWSSGRLLREYTVLLDPPTFAPPTNEPAPSVAAPVRSTPADSGRIERQPQPQPEPVPQQTRPAPQPVTPARQSPQPMPEPAPVAQPVPSEPTPAPTPPAEDAPYAAAGGDDFLVRKGHSLWGIARHLKPDSRLTMNQTMLAIFQANPDAFGGNINVLKAGATLRIPSANEIFQISRGDALSEVQRQYDSWNSVSAYDDSAAQPDTSPSLTLVPPDEEPVDTGYDDASSYEPISREEEIETRISELESADVPNQQSLIEIRDNELASLRQELADIRGEVYEPPVADPIDDTQADVDEPQTDDIGDIIADDTVADDAADDATADEVDADEVTAPAVVSSSSSRDESIVDKIMGFLSQWGIIIGALLLVAGGLFWFMRRGDDDLEEAGPWDRLDDDDLPMSPMSAGDSLESPAHDESIVVVEQDSSVQPVLDETIEAESPTPAPVVPGADSTVEMTANTGFGSLEDTFSSETAVNLDQTDPIAEADFHMAYGLYDQAADLINGALESDPSDKTLMSKLCEIYFVWGNRDAFVDAATRLKANVGDGMNPDWDKIVIMGQQIAADHNLFAGAEVAGATREVDLSFDDEGGAGDSALDMDFGAAADGDSGSDLIDLSDSLEAAVQGDDAVDFDFNEPDAENDPSLLDFDVTAEASAIDPGHVEATAEMPSMGDVSDIDEFGSVDSSGGTSEMPALDESLHQAISEAGQDAAETAEINLDELDLGGLDLDDLEATGQNEALADTGLDVTFDDLGDTGKHSELDETAMVGDELLDATGHTQVLDDGLAVEAAEQLAVEQLGEQLGDGDATMLAPGFGIDETVAALSSEAETLLAPLDDDEKDFDFAKTEALPADTYAGNPETDETIATPAIAATDMDLDLDDLTAALQVSEANDTVEQIRDEATVEQPRPSLADETSEIPTMALAPEDLSNDLNEARTMTEVGTKLDLARAYVDMGDPAGAKSILEEVIDEGDEAQRQQAQQLMDSLPS